MIVAPGIGTTFQPIVATQLNGIYPADATALPELVSPGRQAVEGCLWESTFFILQQIGFPLVMKSLGGYCICNADRYGLVGWT